ncbi:MAG: hypothetical protein ABI405_03350 [Parafilimonas sp.]
MIEWLFTFLLVYLLYKLIFGFILPVYKASADVRSKLNQMNQQQQQPKKEQKTNTKTTVRPPAEDYIDFEEIK